MERVDFYILAGSGRQAAEQFACRLCEKAYNQGNRIFIRAEDGAQTEALDELLWTFRSGSFLPHARVGADDEDTPIVLGERVPERALDLLVNLAGTLDGPWQNFSRLAEVVDQRPGAIQAARQRYRAYRGAGYELHYHNLDKENA